MTRATEELARAQGYLKGLTQDPATRELTIGIQRAKEKIRELEATVAEETRTYQRRVLKAQQLARDAQKIRDEMQEQPLTEWQARLTEHFLAGGTVEMRHSLRGGAYWYLKPASTEETPA